jgi:predicted transcriptional regulator
MMDGIPMTEDIMFYKEWLPLPKAELNILAMLAEQGGTFSGNYTDMCRYLTVTPQSRNRQRLQTAIESLISKGFITRESSGRTQTLKVIPKATGITLPRLWVQSVIQHDYSSEDVAPANVLKVFLWIVQNKQDIVTNDMIAKDLGVSVSTVVSVKNVLEREYENITKRKVSEKCGDIFISLGQELAASAWWEEV